MEEFWIVLISLIFFGGPLAFAFYVYSVDKNKKTLYHNGKHSDLELDVNQIKLIDTIRLLRDK